ncbi:MAG: ABC transporter ATP-binding protein [Caldicoprobacterales bacterium]|jgi:ATP-binding cassette subfamily B multidrug efflux pump|nr:ABC transporter ATP-binding protein [Clostridiales bacterium]
MKKENNSNNQPSQAPRPMKPRGGGGRGHGPMAMMPGEKAKDFKNSMKKLIAYLSVYKIQIITVMLFAMLSAVFTIVGPKVLAQATNELFSGMMNIVSGGTQGINFTRIAQILMLLLGLYLVSTLFMYLQGFIMTDVSAKVSYDLRNAIAAKINKLPLKYFDTTTHGEVLSRVTNDVDMLNQTLNQSITEIISSITTMIGVLIMMLSISWSMTLIALGILPLSFILVTFTVKKSQKYFRAQQEYLGHLNGHVEEMYGGHIVIKAFNREQQSIEKFEEYNNELFRSGWKSQFISGLMMPMMHFVTNVGYVLICVLGAYLTTRGALTVGGIQAFIQYLRSFTQPVTQIANITNVLQQTAAASERIFEFLDEQEEEPDHPRVSVCWNGKPQEGQLQIEGNVEFSHVRFGYDPNKMIINDFSAVIHKGQKVALVGPTGAGKTTIVKLLMRFYELNDGCILIEGHDIREFARDDLRSLFGMVLQDTWLYNNTIMENIRYGKLDATDEEVIAAARAAQADHFIRTLPDSYQMILNEEATNVSQGQKQLLTIARAILSDPKILILDEATSSVDTRTEILIQKAMDHLMEGRTSFVIAHRLSTIKNADLILCLDQGDIVEQGTHEELLKKGGFYANLYNSQFEKIAI